MSSSGPWRCWGNLNTLSSEEFKVSHITVRVRFSEMIPNYISAGTQRLFSKDGRALLLEILLAGFCLELLSLAVALFAQGIFDKVIVHSSLSTLHVLGMGMLLVIAIEAPLVYFYLRHIHYFGARVDAFLTRPAMLKLLRLPLIYFDSAPKGEIANHIREIEEVRLLLSAFSITAVIDALFILFVLGLLFLYSPLLAIVVLLSTPVLAVISVVTKPTVRKKYKVLHERQNNFESLLNEGLQGIVTMKAIAIEPYWKGKWLAAHSSRSDGSLDARRSEAIEETLIRIVNRGVVLLVLWIGAAEVVSNELTMGQMIACYMFALRVLSPSARLFQIVMGFYRMQEAKKHFDALMGRMDEQAARPDLCPYPGGAIEFDRVSYTYPGSGRSVVVDATFRFDQGSFVGIVGQSGSGKSTLARLIQAHLRADSGRIAIDNLPIERVDIHDLRSKVLLVTQDAALFKGTLQENVLCGREFDEDLFSMSLGVVDSEHFFRDMPGGYLAVVGERGNELSSGQRQRICLARAIYRKPKVLILDEATNALDAASELLVLERIRGFLHGTTLILVTHRAHAIASADQVVRVQDGSVRPIQPDIEMNQD